MTGAVRDVPGFSDIAVMPELAVVLRFHREEPPPPIIDRA